MLIPKLIARAVSAVCLLALVTGHSLARADAIGIGLINPLLTPQEQGWLVMENVQDPLDVSANGAFITASTLGAVVPGQGNIGVQLFHRLVPILVEEGFAVEFWLKVNALQSPHNAFDSAIVFYASTQDPRLSSFTGSPRAQFIYFDADEIGWGDESERFPFNTRDDFHHYRIEVESDGMARFYADGQLALQRADFKLHPRLAFGDMTNDPAVNGRFSLSGMTVSGRHTTLVSADFRPSTCPNPLNAHGRGRVPVAIAGTTAFNVNRIDPESVRINGVPAQAWSIRHATRPVLPYVGKVNVSDCTANGSDGRLDLVLAFDEQALLASLGSIYNGQVTTLRVTGKLKPEFGVQAFAGEDIVRIINVRPH